jgi:hypothetical protein
MTVVGSTAHRQPRWGEHLIMAAAAPGLLSGAVLGLVLTLRHFDWQPSPGFAGHAFVWLAMSTPRLSIIGGVTLLVGALAALFVPGRARYKWIALALGTLAWGLAFYWLSGPGPDLP